MIRWGFLGAGWIATTALAPAVHSAKNGILHGVASRDRGRAEALQPQKIYARYEDLLADPEIDAVYINLANHQHCQWAVAALAAGKHVLCEKPLALDRAQGQVMADAAKKYDRVLVEAVWSRWHPRFVRIVELVAGGDIGELVGIDSAFCFTAQFTNNYRFISEMGGGSLLDVGVYQAHLWRALNKGEPELKIESLTQSLGATGEDLTTQMIGELVGIDSAFCFTAQFNNNYRFISEMGGGSLLDVGVYQAHLWRALNEDEPELKIESFTQSLGATGEDLTTQVSGELGNGVKINSLASFEMPETQRLVIAGELATIKCLGNDAFTSWKKPSSLSVGNHLEEFEPVDPYCIMIENFGNHIEGKPAWILPIEQSLYVMKLLDQIKSSVA